MATVLGETKMKYCPKCKMEKELSDFRKNRSRKDGLKCWCRDCCQEDDRKYQHTEAGRRAKRKSDRNQRQLHSRKIEARSAVNNAIATGKLTRPSICESCFGEHFVEGHHEDYSKPLDVEWLCTECHIDLHRKVLV